MGAAFSFNQNTQIANTDIIQTYAGSCDISCNNIIENTSIDTISSQAGGILVKQTCAVNAQCTFNSAQSSLADTLFKVNQAGTSAPFPGGISSSSNNSYQEINQYINNNVSQQCKITSVNKIDNMQIYTVNSNMTGPIVIDQSGSATGSCALSATMKATGIASGTTDQCSASGKKGKKACGKGKSIGSILLYGGIALILFVVGITVYKYFFGSLPPCTPEMPPGTKCEPPKPPVGSDTGTPPTGAPGASQPLDAYEPPQYGPQYEPLQYGTPQYGPPQYGTPQYQYMDPSQPNVQGGLREAYEPEAQPFDAAYLETLGEE